MTETTDNIINRDSLQEAYINMIVDGMDWKTMEQFVYDTIDANLDNYTVEELITEVEDYYPELLQQDEVSVTYGDKSAGEFIKKKPLVELAQNRL